MNSISIMLISVFAILDVISLKYFLRSLRVNRDGQLVEGKIVGDENIGPVLKVEYTLDGTVYQQNILINDKVYGSLNHKDKTIQLLVLKTNPKFVSWKGDTRIFIYAGGCLMLTILIGEVLRRVITLK